jgi:hypothetical protein
MDVGDRPVSMSWAGTEIGVWLALGTANQQDGSFDASRELRANYFLNRSGPAYWALTRQDTAI